MTDYVHSGWCHEIFRQPEFRDIAIESLRKMGVSQPERLDDDQLCARLGEMTCHVARAQTDECASELSAVPAERRMALRCGGKLKCWDVLELDRRLEEDPEFAATLSDAQKRKVKRSVRMARSKTVLPCHVLSGNAEACRNREGCEYHARSLLGALFFSATCRYQDKECHMSRAYLNLSADRCQKLDVDTLYAIVDDIYYDQVSSRMGGPEYDAMTLFERYQFAQDMEQLLQTLQESTRSLARQELCEVVQGYRALNGDPTDQKLPLSLVVRCLELAVSALGLVDRYVTVEMLMKVARWIKVKVSEVAVRGLAIMINLALWVYENLFVSWGLWILLFPAGRAYVARALRDPSLAVFFLIAFKFTGLTDPILPHIDKMSIAIPYADVVPVLQTVAEQGGKAAVQVVLPQVINRDNVEQVFSTVSARLRDRSGWRMVRPVGSPKTNRQKG